MSITLTLTICDHEVECEAVYEYTPAEPQNNVQEAWGVKELSTLNEEGDAIDLGGLLDIREIQEELINKIKEELIREAY